MSTCRDRRCTAAAHVTARQARDASKYFSVAPDRVLSCIEYVGTLYYLSRLVYGLPTFYFGDFCKSSEFPPKKNWESRKHKHQNGVALRVLVSSQKPCVAACKTYTKLPKHLHATCIGLHFSELAEVFSREFD
jgi:hypothetical protein